MVVSFPHAFKNIGDFLRGSKTSKATMRFTESEACLTRLPCQALGRHSETVAEIMKIRLMKLNL